MIEVRSKRAAGRRSEALGPLTGRLLPFMVATVLPNIGVLET
jgi:hypothetical protein